MKIALVTDAWLPQVNGVVTTLLELKARLEARGHDMVLIEPTPHRRFACPGYREIEIAWRPYAVVAAQLEASAADAIHIATEGPLGLAARRWCLRHGRRFTTAFHTRFPDLLSKAVHLPASWGYAAFRRFHAPSSGVMVPTLGMQNVLHGYRFANLRAWSHGVDLRLFRPIAGADLGLPRPVFLYVGRVSYEKNLEAFLALDLPGTKVVYGSGPLLEPLRARFPKVQWRGVVPRHELPAIYSAADAFVVPSPNETFGLVMLEAMACGTPVAAFPVTGPLDVIGDSGGGVLDTDLRAAALRALEIAPQAALASAQRFDWEVVCDQFVGHLVSSDPSRPAWKTDTANVFDAPTRIAI